MSALNGWDPAPGCSSGEGCGSRVGDAGESVRSTGVAALDVLAAAELLEQVHGSADLGNMDDPIDELVWIPLTRQTHRQNAARCWQRIRHAGGPVALLKLSEDELVGLLQDGGFARQKARWIKASLEHVVDRFGALCLDDTFEWTDAEVEELLTSLPGVAIKSAKCVMLYSLGRSVLPVDTHLRRLSERLGWVRKGLSERGIHQRLEALVPPGVRLSLHVNAVWHGRLVCRALRPLCAACVLRGMCARALAGAAS